MSTACPAVRPCDTLATVGAVNQAVIDALLTRKWAELDRLVPRQRVQDPSPEVQDTLFHVE